MSVETILLPTALRNLTITEIAFADFKNGVYRLDGAACAIGDLFVEDVADWGDWDPAVSVVGGSGLTQGNDDSPVASAALFSALWPDGFVALSTILFPSDPGGANVFFDVFTGTSFAEEYTARVASEDITANIKPGDLGGDSNATSGTDNIIHRVIMRFIPGKVSMMRDDGATHVARDPGATPNLTKFAIGVNNGAVIRDITFYSPDVPFMDLFL